MIRIATAQVWVTDQDEALSYYTQKLGMEVRQDYTERRRLGSFRWLTVGPAGQPDIALALMPIPSPVLGQDRHAQLREVVAAGLAGAIFLTTEDCRATYRTLRRRGVEFYEKPQLRSYGVDAGFHDPFGNTFRLVELT